MAPEEERSLADQWVDELVPEELDWVGLVRRYPIASVLVAAAGGFYIGRSRGGAILEALGDLVTGTLDQTADRFLDLAGGDE